MTLLKPYLAKLLSNYQNRLLEQRLNVSFNLDNNWVVPLAQAPHNLVLVRS